jgi:iron(III) transport system ATP-binding protein
MSVTLEGLTKVFPNPHDPTRAIRAVDALSLEIATGELVTLLGPSGCGKTTALRMVGGFETPSAGEVQIAGRRVTHEPPHVRNTAMVFQSYAIFPHLTVEENVGFGLRLRGIRSDEIGRRVETMLELVQLGGLGRRPPDRLSGGQQQRVALARAIIVEPAVLLFDEPLSNLDAKLRAEMRTEIRAIQRRVGITSIYGTHDQGEAMALSDRVVVMRGGRVEQIGTPAEVYTRPATRFVADFVGRVNFLPADPAGPQAVLVRVGPAAVTLAAAAPDPVPGAARLAVIRPEAIRLEPGAGAAPELPRGRVRQVVFLGPVTDYDVEAGPTRLTVSVADPAAGPPFAAGDLVAIRLPATPVALVAPD